MVMATRPMSGAPGLWRELVRAQAVVLPRVHKALRRRHGLSLTELLVLKALVEAPAGEATMSDLQREVNLSPPGVTRVVGALEKRELVSRSRRDADRRLLHVRATTQGRALTGQAQRTVDEVMSRLADAFVDGGEIAAAARVLAALSGGGGDDEA